MSLKTAELEDCNSARASAMRFRVSSWAFSSVIAAIGGMAYFSVRTSQWFKAKSFSFQA
jgi:ABC-type uncharacterized transport system permease subunit